MKHKTHDDDKPIEQHKRGHDDKPVSAHKPVHEDTAPPHERAPVRAALPEHDDTAHDATHDEDHLLGADGKEVKASTGSFVKHKPSGRVGVLVDYAPSNKDAPATVHIFNYNAGGGGIGTSTVQCCLHDLEYLYR